MTLRTIIVGLFIAVLADEILGWTSWFSTWLIYHNAKKVPPHMISRCEEEWLAHLNEIPGRMSKLLFAIDTYRASHIISHNFLLHNVSYYVPLVLRVFDFTLSTVGIILSAPLLFATALLIKLDSKGPILFKQKRIGKDGKVFNILRFRTFKTYADSESGLILTGLNEFQVTRVGHFLHKSNICMLPLLINVMKGEMSVVGPRPEQPSFTMVVRKKFIKDYDYRHRVRPGITGLAQLLHPYGSSIDLMERFKYDKYFVDNLSIRLFIKIWFLTQYVALRGVILNCNIKHK